MDNKDLPKGSYLERLKFDAGMLLSPVAKYIGNIRVVILLVIAIAVLGIFNFMELPQRLNPEVKIPIVTVVTALPGASPEDVESLVTIPLENQVRGVKGVDTVSSTSRDNVSVITAQFFSSVDREKAKTDVKSAIDAVTTLPSDAQAPKVAALDFEDIPVWSFAIHTESDYQSLLTLARTLKNRLKDNPVIDRVVLAGIEEDEIRVNVRPESMAKYGLQPMALLSAVKTGLSSFPAGSVSTDRYVYSLSLDPAIATISDVRNLRIQVSGATVRLADVADVFYHSKNGVQPSYYANAKTPPRRSIVVHVYKLSGTNISDAAHAAKKTVDEVMAPYGNKFGVATMLNTADEIDRQFTDLLGEFRSTIILVFACLFVFLGLRQAFISSLTVPLTFLAAFTFMRFTGMSVNFISMFAFLLALGLLVDDTIVTVSAMTTYFQSGKFTPYETGLMVWRDTIIPIWSTTITTIWSFVPLLLTTGIIGEFIKPIPVVVSVTMISSTAIAVLITLPFMIQILKLQVPRRVVILFRILVSVAAFAFLLSFLNGNPFVWAIIPVTVLLVLVTRLVLPGITADIRGRLGRNPVVRAVSSKVVRYMNHGVVDIEPLSRWYHGVILNVLSSAGRRRKVIIAIVTYAIVGFMLVPLGLVQNEFFPKTNAEEIYLSLELPPGTKNETVKAESEALLDKLRKTTETEFVTVQTGTAMNAMGGMSDSAASSLFTLRLTPKEKRSIESAKISEQLRAAYGSYPKGTVSVMEESSGPPAGADLQIKLSGNDLNVLSGYADKIVAHLKSRPGITNADKTLKPGTSKIVFVPDYDRMAQAGVTADSVGMWLRTYASGFKLGDLSVDPDSTDKTDITLRFGKDSEDLTDVTTLSLPLSGGTVPVEGLGSLVPKTSPTSITRENGKRTISVTAGIRPGYNLTEANRELEAYADSLKLPSGYEWKTGGVNEENNKSIRSILMAMSLAVMLILVTMVLQFGSYRQAIIVLLVIPLAVSSVFYAFALTGTPLSFPALIGILSLFGIVVTNSMFIVDKINLNQKQGMPFEESIADAGASRLEPIILTKLCTVLGLLPITLSNALWRGLGGAIISGILISSTIMLLFIPCVYYAWFSSKPEAKRPRSRK